MSIKDVLEQYLRSEHAIGRNGESIPFDADLLQEGIVDSLGILRLMAFMEKEFRITIPDEKVIPENFNTIRSLSRLVRDLQNTF